MGSAMAGTKAVSRSRAGKVWHGPRVSSAVFAELPREYATDGVPAVNLVDAEIVGTTDGGLGDPRRCGSPKPESAS
jgi:hypothetical protein